MSAYEVLYARQFHEQLMVLPDSVYERVEHSVDVVADNPGLLRVYRLMAAHAGYLLPTCRHPARGQKGHRVNLSPSDGGGTSVTRGRVHVSACVDAPKTA
jgi:hypothetical protein